MTIEREKLAIEKQKITLEYEKLHVEKIKARWTAIAVVVPILGALLTIAFGLWSTRQQAKAQFELKVAEIVMQSGSPEEALGRAQTFVAMFPDRLPTSFASPIDTNQFTTDAPAKKEFLKLLADRGLSKEELVLVWKHLFQGDTWLQDFTLNDILTKKRPDSPNTAVEETPRDKASQRPSP